MWGSERGRLPVGRPAGHAGKKPIEGEATAQKCKRRAATRQRRNAALAGGALLLILLVAFWSGIWPYLLAAGAVGGVVAGTWRLCRRDRFHRDADQRCRCEDAIQTGHCTLAEVDVMSGTEFEDHIAALCRRDGCTDVRRVGGTGDNGSTSSGVFRTAAH